MDARFLLDVTISDNVVYQEWRRLILTAEGVADWHRFRRRRRSPTTSIKRHLLPAPHEGDGIAAQMVGAGVQNRLRRILREIDAAHLVGSVGSGRVEREAGESDDAAGGYLHGHALLVTDIANPNPNPKAGRFLITLYDFASVRWLSWFH